VERCGTMLSIERSCEGSSHDIHISRLVSHRLGLHDDKWIGCERRWRRVDGSRRAHDGVGVRWWLGGDEAEELLWVVESSLGGTQLLTDLASHLLVAEITIASPHHHQAPHVKEGDDEVRDELAVCVRAALLSAAVELV